MWIGSSIPGVGTSYNPTTTSVVSDNTSTLSTNVIKISDYNNGYQYTWNGKYSTSLPYNMVAGYGNLTINYLPDLDNPSNTSYVMQTRKIGESKTRFALRGDGRLEWGPGGSASIDAYLQRYGNGIIGTPGKLVASRGLCVGNTSSSSPDVTRTTKTRKMEIFDSSGTSLGFIQIYSGP